MSRPPMHSSALELPFHEDTTSNLWTMEDQSAYPTPLDKSDDPFLPEKAIAHPDHEFDQEIVKSSSLFESLLVANINGSHINVQKDEISSGRHRSFSHSCAIPRTFNGSEKTIQCPFCDKMFYKKYNLKSHLVSHSSKSKCFH